MCFLILDVVKHQRTLPGHFSNKKSRKGCGAWPQMGARASRIHLAAKVVHPGAIRVPQDERRSRFAKRSGELCKPRTQDARLGCATTPWTSADVRR